MIFGKIKSFFYRKTGKDIIKKPKLIEQNANTEGNELSNKTEIIKQPKLIEEDMNTSENFITRLPDLPVEFAYLQQLIDYRLTNPGGIDLPPMPKVQDWTLPVKKFV